MTVYVDPAAHPFNGMLMCHMWADSIEELLEMADKIGVRRKFLQGHGEMSFGKHKYASWVHFDISKTKRALALREGAVETDRYGPVEFKHVLNLDHSDFKVRDRARKMLNHIRRSRHSSRPLQIQESLL